MATKGDISELDILQFGGKPMIPLVAGFNRFRKSGVVRSDVAGGATRQRKKYFGMPHVASVTFYLRSPMMQDFIQSFINKNEGKKFICHLSADRPIVEPYVVQALSDWNHVEVNSVEGTVTCQFEIFSTKDECLDQFFYDTYSCMGEDTHCILDGLSEVVTSMPINVPPQRITQPLTHVLAPGNPVVKLVGDLTTNRATTGTYIDKNDASLKTAAVNELREEAEGYLIEGSSTNSQLFSQQITTTNDGWRNSSGGTGSAVVITVGHASAPDGSQTASRLILALNGGTASGDTSGIRSTTSSVVGQSITYSIWLKSNDTNSYNLRFDFNGLTADVGTSNITVTSVWKQFKITLLSAEDTGRSVVLRLRGNRNTSDSADILIWGGQHEALPFATSYIPTTVAPVTRSADLISFIGGGNMTRPNENHSIVADFLQLNDSTMRPFGVDDYDYYYCRMFNDQIVLSNGVNTVSSPNTSLSKQMIYINNVDTIERRVYVNGITGGINGSGVYAVQNQPTPQIVVLGNSAHVYSLTEAFFGHIRNFRIYDFALTQEEVELLAGV